MIGCVEQMSYVLIDLFFRSSNYQREMLKSPTKTVDLSFSHLSDNFYLYNI